LREALAVTQEEAFIQDIIAHPDDDAPRLIYADWLDETGDPAKAARAEFIRLQCAREQRRKIDPDCPDEERERQLLAEFEKVWRSELSPIINTEPFVRGFVSSISFETVASFKNFAESALRLAPLTRVVFRFGNIRNRNHVWPALARCPQLLRFSSVDLSKNRLTPKQAEVILNSPFVRNATTLDLSSNELGPNTWRVDWGGAAAERALVGRQLQPPRRPRLCFFADFDTTSRVAYAACVRKRLEYEGGEGVGKLPGRHVPAGGGPPQQPPRGRRGGGTRVVVPVERSNRAPTGGQRSGRSRRPRTGDVAQLAGPHLPQPEWK
jgi:uncharacterized protein (TIGR02996 family)